MARKARLCAGMLILALLIPGIARAESVKAYVARATLAVYESYSTSSDVLGVMSYGEPLLCTGVKGGWARVENAGGAVGYCDVDGLTTSDPNKYSLTAYAQEDGARVYAKATTDSDWAALDLNTSVTVIAVTGDGSWCRVTRSGAYGYMKKATLGTSKVADNSFEPVTVYVSDLAIAVYSSASSSASKGYLGYGEKMTCVALSDDWAKVTRGGYTGYCSVDGLTTDNPNTLEGTVYPQSSSTKVYALPGTSSDVLARVGTQTALYVVARTGDGKWLRVKGDDQYGYVRVSDVDVEKASSGTSSKATQIVNLALEQLGDPYVYATRGPDSFDCSGLTYYCYLKICGITLSRSAEGQGYSSYTKIESISDLKKGDIVCFDTEEGDSDLTDHVGIYLGGGQFVHASSSGGKVMISSLSSGYYNRVFSCGRRILN